MAERLFVYGTLGPGRSNEHVLVGIGGSWLKATVTGTLQEKGWGAEMGYPGIDLNSKGDEIEGSLFTSENLASNWSKLDEFEGEEYERVLTKVKLNDESFVDAYVYTIRKD